MNLKKANEILQHSKDHWSHEVDEAKFYISEFVRMMCYLAYNQDWEYGATSLEDVIEDIENNMGKWNAAFEGKVCGDCKHFDPGFCRCQNPLVPRACRQPLDDACPKYDDGKENGNGNYKADIYDRQDQPIPEEVP